MAATLASGWPRARVDRAMVQLGKWAQAFIGTAREIRNGAGAIAAALEGGGQVRAAEGLFG